MKICSECGKAKAGARSGKCYRCYQRGYRRATRKPVETRRCISCGKRKHLGEFNGESRIRPDGSQAIKAHCRDCYNSRQRAEREQKRSASDRRARDIPGMTFSVCGHGLLSGPCMQCAVARREAAIVELTD